MKKLVVVLILILSIGSQGVYAKSDFVDVNASNWAHEYIIDMADTLNIEGYPDGTFKPNNSITVAEFTKLFVSLLHEEHQIDQSFEGNHWSDKYRKKAIEQEYILVGEFDQEDLDREITRQEIARMVSRVFDDVDIDGSTKNTIKDFNTIADVYQNHILKAYQLGILNGYTDGTFKATGKATRAEALKILSVMNEVMNAPEPIEPAEPSKPSDNISSNDSNIPEILTQIPLSQPYDYTDILSNERMVAKYGNNKISEFMATGKGYVEDWYGVDYQTINKEQFIKTVQWYFMPKTRWIADDGEIRDINDHFAYWADMIVEKEIHIDMEFVTEPSLVYANRGLLVRGLAVYTVKNCNDMEWLRNYTRFAKDVEVGQTYERVVEIELVNMDLREGWEHAERVVADEYFITE